MKTWAMAFEPNRDERGRFAPGDNVTVNGKKGVVDRLSPTGSHAILVGEHGEAMGAYRHADLKRGLPITSPVSYADAATKARDTKSDGFPSGHKRVMNAHLAAAKAAMAEGMIAHARVHAATAKDAETKMRRGMDAYGISRPEDIR